MSGLKVISLYKKDFQKTLRMAKMLSKINNSAIEEECVKLLDYLLKLIEDSLFLFSLNCAPVLFLPASDFE